MAILASCPRVKYWVDHYGISGVEDKRAAHDFLFVETPEVARIFRNELQAIASGTFPDDILDKVVGQRRKGAHGSYKDWAKMMLLWMAEPKT